MRLHRALLALALSLGSGEALRSQTWTVDPSVAPVLSNDVSLLLSASWVPTPGGQFLVFGDFTHINGAAALGLARVGPDGKLDATFTPDFAPNERVIAIAPLADGRSVILLSTTTLTVATPAPATGTTSSTANDATTATVRTGYAVMSGIVVTPTVVTTRLIRLTANGRKDTAYTPIDINGYGHLTPLTDGSVMLWGNFLANSTPSRSCLLRLKSDGTVDAAFNRGIGAANTIVSGLNITAGAPAPNGAFVCSYLAWFFGDMPAGGGSSYHLDRILPNGTTDPQFTARVTSTYPLLAVQTDGTVLAAGAQGPAIATTSATAATAAATSVANGPAAAVDPVVTVGVPPITITPPTVPPPIPITPPLPVTPVAPAARFVSRFAATGALDSAYDPQIPNGQSISKITPLPGGRIAAEASVGRFTSGSGPAVFTITGAGQLERDWRTLPGAREGQRLLAALGDGRVLLAQGTLVLNSTSYYPVPYLPAAPTSSTAIMPIFLGPVLADPALAISPPDASAGPTTPLTTLSTTVVHRYAGSISRLASDPAGSVLAAGQFTQIDNQPRPGLARFAPGGALDAGYNPPPGNVAFTPPDGRVIVQRTTIGPVNAADGYHRYVTDIARLQANGSVDSTFAFPSPLDPSTTSWLAAGADGRLLIAAFDPDASKEENLKLMWLGSDGRRQSTLPTVISGFTRFIAMPAGATLGSAAAAAGGSVDAMTNITVTTATGSVGIAVPTDSVTVTPTATQAAPPNSPIIAQPAFVFGHPNPMDAVQILANGQLLIAGAFSKVNGVDRPGLARLQADGALDAAYQPAVSSLSYHYAIVPLPDGRALVFGSRVNFGRWQAAVIRLRVDGSLDPTFVPPPDTFGSDARGLSDGSIFSGGRRFTADGWPDLNFGLSLGLDRNAGGYGLAAVRATAAGALWIGGSFEPANGTPRNGLVRLAPTEIVGITVPPKSQTVVAGRDAIFQVATGTTQPATYRWTHDGATIAGATNPHLRLPNVSATDAGVYRAAATIGGQTFTSEPATLTVAPSRAKLVNFSALSNVGAAPQIAGVVCAGPARQMLLRAIGYGLPGVSSAPTLPMPVLTLYAGSAAVAADRGGATDAMPTALAAKVGAFPVNRASNATLSNAVWGSALTPTLGDGVFTAVTTPGTSASGMSLFECYDTGDDAAAPLIRNFSIRAQNAPGSTTLTAGFVIGGDGPLRVLIRGLGPALATFGITDPIASPRLDFFANGAGTPAASNTGWGGDANIAAAASRVGAFALPANSRDAALLVTLEPGAYTVQLTGATGAIATGMIEIYALQDN